MNRPSVDSCEERLRQYLGGRGPDREVEVAGLIRDLMIDPRGLCTPHQLRDFLAAVPWIRETDVALDAAIQLVLAPKSGGDRERAVAALDEEFPELRRAIQRAAILGAGVEPAVPGDEVPGTRVIDRLPAGFGPPDYDGAPRYELRSLLGSGCEGSVFEALDRLYSDRNAPCFVAVKIGHREAGEEARRVASLESARLRRLSHAGVVRLIDHGQDEQGCPYAVFELVDGVPLDTWVRSRGDRLPVRAAARLAAGLCDAVQAAHSAGVVHRDLKPSHVLIDRDGKPRITDFCFPRDSRLPLDATGGYSGRGSLAFMAPEQYRREPGADAPAADVYALGGLLYWLLTQRFPNGGTASEAVERLEQIDERPPEVSAARAGVPSSLARIVERALSPSFSARHGSAQELGDDLRDWLEHRPVGSRHTSHPRRAMLLVRRHPVAFAAGAAALISLAVFAGVSVPAHYARQLSAVQELAAARENELRVRLQKADEREAWQEMRDKEARDQVRAWLNVLQSSKNVESGEYIAILGSMSELVYFQHESLVMLVTQKRLETARGALAELESKGLAGSFEATMWNGLLGSWLLRAGEPTEALPHLERAERAMAGLLKNDDPWLVRIRESLASARRLQVEHVGPPED